VFIFLDDVQLPLGRSYVSRTQVLGPAGTQWLSIPVERQNGQRILDARFARSGNAWARKHLANLKANYARAPFFEEVWALLQPLYAAPEDRLAAFNQRLIEALADYLGINQARRVRASELAASGPLCSRGPKDEGLIALVRSVGGDTYLSGPGGTRYQ